MISLFSFAAAAAISFPDIFQSLRVEVSKILTAAEKANPIVIICIIFLANFAMKLALSFYVPESFYYHDGAHYSSIAMHIYRGEGFISSSLWDVMLRKDSIPFPETSRAPLMPYAIALFYKLLGVSFFVEKFLSVILSSLVPVAGYLFFRKVSGDKASILGAVLLSFDWTVFANSRVVHTELAFMLAGTLFLLAVFRLKESPIDYIFAGMMLAVSYLVRYQAIYAFPLAITAYLWSETGSLKTAMIRTAAIIAIFVIIVSPWLMRNMEVAGGPFASDLGYLIVGAYGGRDFSHYVYSLDTVPETFVDVALRDPAMVIKEYANTMAGYIYQTPVLVFGNPLLFLLAILGAWKSGLRKKYAAALFAYVAMTYITLSITLPVARYLFHLIPIFALFSAIGIINLSNLPVLTEKIRKNLMILAMLFIIAVDLLFISFAYADLDAKGESSLNTYRLFQDFIIPTGLKNATLMVDSFPYFYEYYSQASMNVLQFPYYTNEADFYSYMEKYGVEYIVLHNDSILRIPVSLPESFSGEKVFEGHMRTVYRVKSHE